LRVSARNSEQTTKGERRELTAIYVGRGLDPSLAKLANAAGGSPTGVCSLFDEFGSTLLLWCGR
jgi:hypothetical protein